MDTLFAFDENVVYKWQTFWTHVCDMAYYRKDVCSELKIFPSFDVEVNLSETYKFTNFNELTLDYIWDNPKKYNQALVVSELKTIFVPKCLFECIGVYKWFEYSFPNCEIVFWESLMN